MPHARRFLFALVAVGCTAHAFYAGAQQQQFPPQQQQPQQYPQQQPYPQQPQQYPQQQPYPPPQGQPYPQQGYPPPQGYPPQGYQPPPPPPPPQQPASNARRDDGEMVALYVASAAYGVGTGVWLDSLFKVDDFGVAVIAPIALGVAAPIGAFVWDRNLSPARGVPSSMATGLVLGAVEGAAISGVHWQYSGNGPIDGKAFRTYSTVTFLAATGGGIGGYAFGEWLRPEPRGLAFVGSSAAWGTISGTLLGVGFSGRDWKDGAAIAGLIGYNVGVAAGGIVSTQWTPSWHTQQTMWIGYALGAGAGALVFPAYLFCDDCNAKGGFVAMGFVSLIGLGAGTAYGIATESKMASTSSRYARLAPLSPRFEAPIDVTVAPPPKFPRMPWSHDVAVESGGLLSATRKF